MAERQYYLDNLRTLVILLLFPYHTCMIYNSWGETFYIHGQDLLIPSLFVGINWTWMMPTLFVIAGISSRYALRTRNLGQFAKERVSKLLIPLIFGILLIMPVQSYIAGLFWTGSAVYMESFTRVTDLSGYDGAFGVGHLWFILFLFVISMVSIPIMALYKKKGKGTFGARIPLALLILFGILPCIGNELFDISGKSPVEYLAYFLFGYFFVSQENILERLDRYRFQLLGLCIACFLVSQYFGGMFAEWVSWISVLAFLGIAIRHLNHSGKIWRYLSKSSFGVYLFHQSWIIVAAFFVFKLTDIPGLQIPLIIIPSVVLTYITYEGARRVSVFRWMFALKR